MKYTTEQLILAAHVRALALDLWRGERNALSDKWHAANPGQSRDMAEFSKDLHAAKSFNDFIAEATTELEKVTTVMLRSQSTPEAQG